MMALAFLATAGGLALLVAGVTGSSFASVIKGHPDRAHLTDLGSLGGPSTVEGESAGGSGPPIPAGAGSTGRALADAITQLGVPYKWGGELAKVEFDCSGLVQWAYGQAGIKLPRTAEEQFHATHRIGPSEATAGDLVFFGNGREVSHVGIVVRPGVMLDAPHTGANVRYENFPKQLGASWGSDRVIGYGRA
jgi:cell wall-associated NlpC family hydrolase